MRKMPKKIMVLAGGSDQIELINGLRKRYPGVEIILIDMSANVRAREYADRQLVISTMDFDAVLAAAEKEQIDLILVNCGDQPLRTMAYVSEKLHLPCYLSFEQSLDLTNKIRMKEKMIESGIPTSKFKKINLCEEVDLSDFEYPLVIKPSDNNGSKGIIRIETKEELNAALDEAKKFSKIGELLVEEFKEGEELSVEAFIKNGEPHIVMATRNNKIKNRNTFTICQNEYVGKLEVEVEQQLLKIIKEIGMTFKIDNVPILIQLINGRKGLSVIEFSARTGGGSKLFFIRRMVGVNVIENLIDITEGLEPDIAPTQAFPYGCVNYMYVHPGKFMGFENLEELKDQGYIDDTFLYKPFGTEIKTNNYSSDRPAGFMVVANSAKELQDKVKYIDSKLKVINEKGEDIMIHGLYY